MTSIVMHPVRLFASSVQSSVIVGHGSLELSKEPYGFLT